MDYELIKLVDDYIKQKRYRLINSILLYKDNELILERYYNKSNQNKRGNIKSIWKSILSICMGICLDKGYIKNLNQPISNYIDAFNQNKHPYHKMITIYHLLTMTSGIYWNKGIHYNCPMLTGLMQSNDLLEHLSDIHMANFPGIKHEYKEWDVILLSTIISKATGMNTFDFCNEYLYKPLDIKSGRWWTSKCSVTYNIGKNEVEEASSDLSARDLAKLGFLLLNQGKHADRQVVSREYIKKAITPAHENELMQNGSYGLMWWIGDNWYGARGAGGQEITVMPDKNIVYVIQASKSMSKRYSDVFDFLLEHL
ncbi:serine hydrolase [Clostridiaceae bacterium M8S5]|nr:serine hydrolase [Clostridiaceae bacterium M8S5]